MKPKITIDPDFGFTYIQVTNNRISYTKEMGDGVYVDFDKDDQIVGIEMLKQPEIEELK